MQSLAKQPLTILFQTIIIVSHLFFAPFLIAMDTPTATTTATSSSSQTDQEQFLPKLSKDEAKKKLLTAADDGKLDLVTQIITDFPKLINCQNDNQSTALHQACKLSHLPIIEYLLANKAKITLKDSYERLPYNAAAMYGNQQCMNAISKYAKTLDFTLPELTLHESVACGNQDRLQTYLNDDDSNIEEKGFCNFSLLHAAVAGEQTEIAKRLIAAGADKNAVQKDLLSPLHLAAWKGYLNVAELLINAGADINIRNSDGETALDIAKENGFEEIIKRIKNAPQQSATTRINETAPQSEDEEKKKLLIAAGNGKLNEIKQIIAAFPELINCQNDNKDTALHIACNRNALAVVRYLLEKEANIKLKNSRGILPYNKAALLGNISCRNAISEHAKKLGIDLPELTLHESVACGDRDRLQTYLDSSSQNLIEKILDTKVKNPYGYSLFYAVVIGGHTDIAKQLIDAGAHKIALTVTPLHFAIMKKHIDIAKLLLDADANKDAQTSEHYTPLHIAAWQGYPEVVELLLKSKAKTNIKTNEGKTALGIARSKPRSDANLKIIQLLKLAEISELRTYKIRKAVNKNKRQSLKSILHTPSPPKTNNPSDRATNTESNDNNRTIGRRNVSGTIARRVLLGTGPRRRSSLKSQTQPQPSLNKDSSTNTQSSDDKDIGTIARRVPLGTSGRRIRPIRSSLKSPTKPKQSLNKDSSTNTI